MTTGIVLASWRLVLSTVEKNSGFYTEVWVFLSGPRINLGQKDSLNFQGLTRWLFNWLADLPSEYGSFMRKKKSLTPNVFADTNGLHDRRVMRSLMLFGGVPGGRGATLRIFYCLLHFCGIKFDGDLGLGLKLLVRAIEFYPP